MADRSSLDGKYFIDDTVYNCPFCNRRNVVYSVIDHLCFDWSEDKTCHVWLVKCSSCNNRSMHLSYRDVSTGYTYDKFHAETDLDDAMFYSVPTSFFVMDSRIPRVLRELITEAAGCVKMNFLTGASACTRKAVYELLVREEAQGADYEGRIKSLKAKHPEVDPSYFDVLSHIKDMTSEKVHEQSWDEWDSRHLSLILEALKAAVHEIYVVPDERRARAKAVLELRKQVIGKEPGTASD